LSEQPSITQTTPLRCLIVEDETLVAMGLHAHLQRLGHVVVAQASNASEAETLYRQQEPDLVLMDIRLNKDDGIAVATRLLQQRPCPIIIISAFDDQALVKRASDAGVFGYLTKPITPRVLAPQIQVAVQRFNDHRALTAQKEALETTLAQRKTIEKAKGLIMQSMHISEAEAHKYLQHESQRRRQNIHDVARLFVETPALLNRR